MTAPDRGAFRLGFSTLGCPDYSVPQIIALAERTALRHVELRFVRGTVDIVDLPEFGADLSVTRRAFDDAGVVVGVIDTSVRMNSTDPTTRAQNLELAKRSLEIAVGLDSAYLRVFAGDIPDDQDPEATRDAVVSGLSVVADLTSTAGVESIIETHDSCSTSESVQELFSAGASDRLGVLWDSLHTFRFGETPDETWGALGARIRHVHVKDATFATREAFDFALPGDGIAPMAEILDLLAREGYVGGVNFEWEKGWHPEIAGPEIAVPAFAQWAGRWLQ